MVTNQEKDVEEVTSRDWSALPKDISSVILSRLFFNNFTRFHCVCKSWQSVRALPLSSPIDFPITPSQWLMFNGQQGATFSFYNPLCKDMCRVDMPELCGAILRFSKDGWLLMSKGKYAVFFINPFTKEKIDLPDLPGPEGYCFNGICFTSSPTTSDCVVFGIFGYFEDNTFFSFVRHGEEAWTFLKFKIDVPFYPSQSNPIFYKGSFWCSGRDGKIGIFEVKEESIWRVLDRPQPLCDRVDESYLLECDGKLLSVFVDDNGREVSVYRLIETRMAWKRIRSLGDKMLFVSHCTSLAAKKKVDGMEDRIYFPRFYRGDGVFYSLKTNMMQTFRSDFSRNDFYNTKEQMHCTWIEPNTTTHTRETLSWNLI